MSGKLRRFFASVVAVALVASVLAAIAGPASAAHQWLEWNDDGASFATFGANQLVSIRTGTIEYACDSFYPAADIYVVPTGVTPGQQLSDVAGAPNTVFGASGGLFLDETVAITAPSGTLGAGTYAVVYDECQDGRVGEDDAVFDPAFRVELPADVPDIVPALAQLKTDAATQRLHWQLILGSYDAIKEIKEAKETLDCILSGLAGCLVQMGLDHAREELIDALRTAAGFQDPEEAARDVVLDLISGYHGIALDPPDPAFRQVTALRSPTVVASDSGDAIDGAWAQVAASAATEGALVDGLLRSIERYQGADEAGAGTWAVVHARAGADVALLLADQLGRTDAALAALAGALDADPRPFDSVGATFAAERDRIAAQGFDGHQRRALDALGLSEAEQSALRARIAQTPYTAGAETALHATVGELRTLTAAAAGRLRDLGADLGAIGGGIAAQPGVAALPTVHAGGPYSTSVGVPVDLTAAVSPAAATLAWDLDADGAFDDATGPSAVFTPARSGPRLVGLQATDAGGGVASAYAVVDVTDPGAAPRLALTPAHDVEVTPGTAVLASSGATDPDGDALTYRWTLDGDLVGENADVTVAPSMTGQHVLAVEVSDGRHARRAAVGVRVVAPDADADAWRADVDCDDADARRNPGNTEIAGNGIDDDCDDTTGDGFADPRSVVFEGRATFLHTSANDNPAPPAVVDLAANGMAPGDVVALTFTTVEPFSFYGCWGPFADPYGVGVFSSSTTVLSKTERHRVPGAIDTNLPEAGEGHTYYNHEPIGIPEDFSVPAGNGFFVQVPPGAAYVLFGLVDSYFADNCGKVRITVRKVYDAPRANAAPVAQDDSATTPERTAVEIPVATLLGNDTDADGDELHIDELLTDVATRGSAVLDGDIVRYTPQPAWVGPAVFRYTTGDSLGGRSTATVIVDVTPVNDPPETADDAATTRQDVAAEVSAVAVLANDRDPEDDALSVLSVYPLPDTIGTATLADGTIRYVPASGFSGRDRVGVVVTDAHGATATSVLTMLVTPPPNTPPVAVDDHAETRQDATLVIPAATLLANDSDADGNDLTIVAVSDVADGHGSAVLEGEVVRFTPESGYVGPARFSYTISDTRRATASAAVGVHVTPANEPPSCAGVAPDPALLWSPNHKFRTVTVSGASDPDGDVVALRVTGVTQDEPTNGLGDGDTGPDARWTDRHDQVDVRAERAGTEDGRVYRITVSGDDGRGGTCATTVVVGVPKSQAPRDATPVDSGRIVDSFSS